MDNFKNFLIDQRYNEDEFDHMVNNDLFYKLYTVWFDSVTIIRELFGTPIKDLHLVSLRLTENHSDIFLDIEYHNKIYNLCYNYKVDVLLGYCGTTSGTYTSKIDSVLIEKTLLDNPDLNITLYVKFKQRCINDIINYFDKLKNLAKFMYANIKIKYDVVNVKNLSLIQDDLLLLSDKFASSQITKCYIGKSYIGTVLVSNYSYPYLIYRAGSYVVDGTFDFIATFNDKYEISHVGIIKDDIHYMDRIDSIYVQIISDMIGYDVVELFSEKLYNIVDIF